jgi:hypothetical protein
MGHACMKDCFALADVTCLVTDQVVSKRMDLVSDQVIMMGYDLVTDQVRS